MRKLITLVFITLLISGCIGSNGGTSGSDNMEVTEDRAIELLQESVNEVSNSPVVFDRMDFTSLKSNLTSTQEKAERAKLIVEKLEAQGNISSSRAEAMKHLSTAIIELMKGDIAHAKVESQTAILSTAQSDLANASTSNLEPVNSALSRVENARSTLQESRNHYQRANESLNSLDTDALPQELFVQPVRDHVTYQLNTHLPYMDPLIDGWESYIKGLRSFYQGLGILIQYQQQGDLSESEWQNGVDRFKDADTKLGSAIDSFENYSSQRTGSTEVQVVSDVRTVREANSAFLEAAQAGLNGNTQEVNTKIQEGTDIISEIAE